MFNNILVHNLYGRTRFNIVSTLVIRNKLRTKNKRITMDDFTLSAHDLRFAYKIQSIDYTHNKKDKICKILRKCTIK